MINRLDNASVNQLEIATLDPARVKRSSDGYLDGFFDLPTSTNKYSFTNSAFSTPGGMNQNDAWSIETPPTPATIQLDSGGNIILPASGLLPRPTASAASPLALALKPLDALVPGGSYGENPYPSDADTTFNQTGGFLTYELVMVTVHFPWVWDTALNPPDWNYVPGTDMAWLGMRDLTIVIDHTVTPPVVDSSTITAFVALEMDPAAGFPAGEVIRGIEPTITADGRLILFNGSGTLNGTNDSQTTYIFNPDGAQATGWSAPRPIADLHHVDRATLIGTTGVEIQERYPLAREPLKDPDGTEYSTGVAFKGTYPWISKDGSFFVASHSPAFDNNGSGAIQAGLMVCGDVTGWHVKHVDDASLNPTRGAGAFTWPYPMYAPSGDGRPAIVQFTTSTGLEPGIWKPLRDTDAPIPTTDATFRVPVLPVFSLTREAYGEVVFHEVDGNYLCYLSCNESFYPNNSTTGAPQEVDITRTPDTSGQVDRCDPIVEGAQFPQEVYGAASLRQSIGDAAPNMNGGKPLHENVGFKGQALMFGGGDRVKVLGCGSASDKLTIEAFVKALDGWDDSAAGSSHSLVRRLNDDQSLRYELLLLTDGRFRLKVRVHDGSVYQQIWTTTSANWITPESDPFSPHVGWRHVAVTFDGDAPGGTSVELFVDGVLQAQSTRTYTSTLGGTTSSDLIVGPISSGSISSGTNQGRYLLLDEVALSSVVRTDSEIKSAAYVVPDPSAFTAWPAGAPTLPSGLEEEDAFWPTGVSYDADVVTLGSRLFSSKILSEEFQNSCTTCHDPTTGFAGTTALAPDLSSTTGGTLRFNTPTVLNAGFGAHKFFDGRAASLEDQVLQPISDPKELNLPIGVALERLNTEINSGPSNPWRVVFEAAFGTGAQATSGNLQTALAMYLRSLNSADSKADDFSLLLEDERRGRALFFGKARCFECHGGSAFTNDDFRNVLTVDSTLHFNDPILGRGGETGRSSEEGLIKVPTLRNVGRTKPFFHDGSAAELEDVIDHYNVADGVSNALGVRDRQFLPLMLTGPERSDLAAFLRTLDGN